MDYYLTLLSFGPEGWGDQILKGVGTTVSLALATLPFGLVVGFMVALAKQSSERSMRIAGNIYTTIFRGLPELLTIFLIYYGAQLGIRAIIQIYDPNTAIEMPPFVAGMIALGIMFSSYASEVFLAAFRAIPKGQYEGGYAIGLSWFQTMRLVVMPQLIRLALPGLSNLWLIMFKDTALISVIGLTDIMRQTNIAARTSKQAFLFYGVACLLYLILAVGSSFIFKIIERWANRASVQR